MKFLYIQILLFQIGEEIETRNWWKSKNMGSYKQKMKSLCFSFVISNGFYHQTNFGWCLLPKQKNPWRGRKQRGGIPNPSKML